MLSKKSGRLSDEFNTFITIEGWIAIGHLFVLVGVPFGFIIGKALINNAGTTSDVKIPNSIELIETPNLISNDTLMLEDF